MKYRSGVVSVVGRPNVGKSSLINAFLRCKATIVSSKPQTTRDNIRCILNSEKGQIVFLDTPGIHKPLHKLGESLVKRAGESLMDSDLVLYVVEASDCGITPQDRHIVHMLKDIPTPVVMAINKADLLGSKKAKLLPLMDSYRKALNPKDLWPLSAKFKINLEGLLDLIYSWLPEGPPIYEEDVWIDRPSRFLAEELIREKILAFTDQEVPHSAAVEIQEYKSKDEYERPDTYIKAFIYVERDGQKAIILGSKGDRIKRIGTEARKGLEELLGGKVYLDLWVKVKKDWRNSDSELRRLGYR